MQKIQLKFQKLIVVSAFIMAAVIFLYALGFSTNLYSLSYHADSTSKLLYVQGAELYKEVQPYNRELFSRSVILFLVSLTLFLTLTNRRRLYYPANYISSTAFAVYGIYNGVDIISHCLDYRAKYLQVDFATLKEITTKMNMDYIESTFMLDAGIVLSLVLILVCVALVVNFILKFLWMRQEHWAEEVALA